MPETNRQAGKKLIWLIILIAAAVAAGLLLTRPKEESRPKTLTELAQQTEAPTQEEFTAAAGEDYPLSEGDIILALGVDDTTTPPSVGAFDYFTKENKETVFAAWAGYAEQQGWQQTARAESQVRYQDGNTRVDITMEPWPTPDPAGLRVSVGFVKTP